MGDLLSYPRNPLPAKDSGWKPRCFAGAFSFWVAATIVSHTANVCTAESELLAHDEAKRGPRGAKGDRGDKAELTAAF